MKIVNNAMVTYHYKITDSETNKEIESTYDNDAQQYIHGITEVPKGLAEALVSKEKGDVFDIELPPEKAFGQYNPEAVGRVPSKYVFLPGGRAVKGKLQPGTQVEVRTDYGVVEAWLLKQGLKNMDVDTNHKFAGKTLAYTIRILDVREATSSEISAASSCNTGCGCC